MTARKQAGFFRLRVVSVQGRMFFQDDMSRVFKVLDQAFVSQFRASPGRFQVREGKTVVCRGVISVNNNAPLEITRGTLPDGTKGEQERLLPEQLHGLELRIFPPEQERPDLMKRVPEQYHTGQKIRHTTF